MQQDPFPLPQLGAGNKETNFKESHTNSVDDNVCIHVCSFLHVSFTQDGTVLYHAISDEKLRKQLKKRYNRKH